MRLISKPDGWLLEKTAHHDMQHKLIYYLKTRRQVKGYIDTLFSLSAGGKILVGTTLTECQEPLPPAWRLQNCQWILLWCRAIAHTQQMIKNIKQTLTLDTDCITFANTVLQLFGLCSSYGLMWGTTPQVPLLQTLCGSLASAADAQFAASHLVPSAKLQLYICLIPAATRTKFHCVSAEQHSHQREIIKDLYYKYLYYKDRYFSLI